jgi:signal transduction histidine kinase
MRSILKFQAAFLGACAMASIASGQARADALLTNAADVISLPADRAARHLPVLVMGTVTAADPTLGGRFFLQDATGGVFVDFANGPRPAPGDVLRVAGISDAGAYAPVITAPTVVKTGNAPLPAAKPVSIDRLISGAEDSQRIETSGVVHSARLEQSRLILDLVSGGFRFRVYTPVLAGVDPATLIAAEVRVRGTAAEAHNRSLRQLVAVEVYVPLADDFQVLKPEPGDPFQKPVVPLGGLAQYRRDNSLDRRVHVKGIVTLQRLGENLFLEDASGALQVQSRQATALVVGQEVEAVGFPSFESFLPVLQDAVLRATSQPAVAVSPKPASVVEMQQGLHHAGYVSLTGRLLDRAVRVAPGAPRPAAGILTTLVLQNADAVFTAQAEEPRDQARMPLLPIGSRLQVGGICLTEIDSDGKLKSFRMLIGSPKDVRILSKPSWLTQKHLLTGLAGTVAVLVVIAGWTVMVSKKNSVLNYLIREREKAQIELQQAHDLLEERVKQRTAELKLQISARKESELQFKAMMGERTRLAQELHDTVEQTLTGIALQLDAAAKLHGRAPDGMLRHLELARNLMAKSQVEVRRSVWDLRCRALEQFDLPGALLSSARQVTCGTSIRVELEAKGPKRPLPETVEENLLRIGQEALTNVIKHSRATLVKIELEFHPLQIALEIKDNGVGFAPESSAGPREGHFGLLGMSERAKRLGGRFTLTSAPGSGTTVRVELPLEAAPPSSALSQAPYPNTDEELREHSHPHC